jgi:hypothetical protein
VGGELAFWAALFVLCCTVHIMARHGMEIRGIRYRTAALPLPPPRGSVRTTAERWVAQNLLPKRPHAEKTKMERIQIRPNLTTPLPAFALEPSVAVCSSQLFLVDNGMDVCARVQVVPAAVCSVVWRRPVMTPTSARLRKDSKLKALRRQTSPSPPTDNNLALRHVEHCAHHREAGPPHCAQAISLGRLCSCVPARRRQRCTAKLCIRDEARQCHRQR